MRRVYLAVREGSSPAMHAVMAGRVSANARTRGMPCRAGFVSWANNTHLSPTVRRFTPHSWSNGRQPPTATCGNARDQPPSQRHVAWKLNSIVRNREDDDELSRPEGPVASIPHGLRSEVEFRKNEDEISQCFVPLPAGYRVVEKKRTPGLIFGSPVAGAPVRRGGALVRRPATAGPPGATLKPISACFMGRGRGCRVWQLEILACPPPRSQGVLLL